MLNKIEEIRVMAAPKGLVPLLCSRCSAFCILKHDFVLQELIKRGRSLHAVAEAFGMHED